MTEDVLARVPLPGWTVFDAVLLSSRRRRRSYGTSHSQGDEDDDDHDDAGPASIASIHRWKRRTFVYLLAVVLLVFNLEQQQHARVLNPASKSSGREGTTTSSATSPPSVLSYNASTIPLALNPPARLSIMRGLVATRVSSHPHDLDDNFVSAIIVHSPYYPLENTQLVVNLAARYPFIREIIVWNNDLAVQLSSDDLKLPVRNVFAAQSPPPSLRILNAPSSFSPYSVPVHRVMPPSHAKHLACALANHDACLFLSPHSLPIHLDSLYTMYLSTAPGFSQIVSVIPSEDYYRLQHLRFQNDQVDLHTAAFFLPSSSAPAQFGTEDAEYSHRELPEHMVSKAKSRRFWKQISVQNPAIPGDQADIVWSVWMNTFPELLVAPSLPFLQAATPPATRAEKAAQDNLVLSSLQSLYTILNSQSPFLSPDPFPLAPSPPKSHYRAPTHDDRGLFISNLDPFSASPSQLRFHNTGDALAPATAGTAVQEEAGLISRVLTFFVPKRRRKGFVRKREERKRAGAGDPASAVGVDAQRSIKPSNGFNPFVSVRDMSEYQELWHARPSIAERTGTSSQESREQATGFPSSLSEFTHYQNPYQAVNGRHPLPENRYNTTCWYTPSAPVKDDYYGMEFIEERELRNFVLFGTRNLGNLVGKGEEDLTAESWEVWTLVSALQETSEDSKEAKAAERWIQRRFDSPPSSDQLGSTNTYKITVSLVPYRLADVRASSTAASEGEDKPRGFERKLRAGVIRETLKNTEEEQGGAENADADAGDGIRRMRQKRHALPDTQTDPEEQGTRDAAEIDQEPVLDKRQSPVGPAADNAGATGADDQAPRFWVRGIKFVSRDRKHSPVRVCGFQMGAWII